MTTSGELAPLPGFAGVVRLFPLPNLVMFPHVMQPLHIFEPRYREMLEDALAGDNLIAMALLTPGWQSDYEGRPPIAPVVCLSRVVSHARQDDGRYNILLHGARRARVTRELDPTHSFRTAEVTLLEDEYPASGTADRERLGQQLLDAIRSLVGDVSPLKEHFDQLLSEPRSLGVLTDMAAFSLNFALSIKQELLAECNVDERVRILLEQLASYRRSEDRDESPGARPFPPECSEN